MFIDRATISVAAGNGGDGAVSFRHEIYVDKGGPDGGNGGNGGNVVFVTDKNTNTLAEFRFQPELKAEPGQRGGKRNKHGKRGNDLLVKVPEGTSVYKDEELLADLLDVGQTTVIARGGRGGFGNAHFKSSTRQTPRVAEKGEPGEEFALRLELKLIADVGLIGMPNAGKSTLLSVISNARPEVADYAFTTLTPHLGVAEVGGNALLVADIPGLIEGAAKGKGLGHKFLQHVERTSVLLHLIDAYSNNIAKDYQTIRAELEAYDSLLSKKTEVIALTKVEGLDTEIIEDIQKQLAKVVPKKTKIFAISAQAHMGLDDLLYELQKCVKVHKTAKKTKANKQEKAAQLPTFTLGSDQLAWKITSSANNTFIVTGKKIEKFALRTDFTNFHGRQRLRDIMKKMGITHELIRKGATPDSQIRFNKNSERFTLQEIED